MIALLLMAAAPSAPMPEGPALRASIEQRDAELFDLFFVRPCNVPRFRELLAPDVEFYHDKGGFNVHNADEFVAIYQQNCGGRADPTTWRSRRELVRSSLHVDPVPGHGAIEAGEHLFYERKGDGPERLAGKARFAMVWKWDAGHWKLSRVLSFAHSAAEP